MFCDTHNDSQKSLYMTGKVIEERCSETNTKKNKSIIPLNRSKFLNEEQRDQILQFASDNKYEIIKQSRSNRIRIVMSIFTIVINLFFFF